MGAACGSRRAVAAAPPEANAAPQRRGSALNARAQPAAAREHTGGANTTHAGDVAPEVPPLPLPVRGLDSVRLSVHAPEPGPVPTPHAPPVDAPPLIAYSRHSSRLRNESAATSTPSGGTSAFSSAGASASAGGVLLLRAPVVAMGERRNSGGGASPLVAPVPVVPTPAGGSTPRALAAATGLRGDEYRGRGVPAVPEGTEGTATSSVDGTGTGSATGTGAGSGTATATVTGTGSGIGMTMVDMCKMAPQQRQLYALLYHSRREGVAAPPPGASQFGSGVVRSTAGSVTSGSRMTGATSAAATGATGSTGDGGSMYPMATIPSVRGSAVASTDRSDRSPFTSD